MRGWLFTGALALGLACRGGGANDGDATDGEADPSASASTVGSESASGGPSASTGEATGGSSEGSTAGPGESSGSGGSSGGTSGSTGAAIECPPDVDEMWSSRAALLRPRGEHANATWGGRIFIFGGIHNSSSGPSEVEAYDPLTDTWEDVTSMPEARNHFTVGYTVYEDELWIVGGKLDGPGLIGSPRVDVYNLADDEWRRGPDLPEAHWAGPAVIVGNQLHAVTGAVSNTVSTDHHYALDLDDPDAAWVALDPIPDARVHVAGVPLGDEIWIIGGELHHQHDGDTTTVQVYDTASDTWATDVPQLPQGRSHHEWATFVHNGAIWSVSGVDSSMNPRGQETIWRLPAGGDAWEALPDLPARLVSPGAKIMNGVLHVFGGGVDDWFDGTLVDHHVRCTLES